MTDLGDEGQRALAEARELVAQAERRIAEAVAILDAAEFREECVTNELRKLAALCSKRTKPGDRP